MAINAEIYKNGVRGLLSHYEIDTLPYDYEIYKSMFHDATTRKEDKDRNNKKKFFQL